MNDGRSIPDPPLQKGAGQSPISNEVFNNRLIITNMATQISNNNSISSNMNNFERVLPTMPVIVKSPKISATAETSSTSSPPASSTSFPTTDSTDIITSTTRTTTSTAISPTIKSISNNNNKRKNLINPREKGNEDDGGKTIKKIKRVKDPNAPKRPANAYI
ncbi:9282_t:CDS:1 [Entrophospora sp. SA101]|nr:9282_t:CDS:1 [Entrophospora sp. SA101]